MRRAIVILLTSLLSGLLAAQVYFPMPDSAARWRIDALLGCDSFSVPSNEFIFSDSAIGDTLISGMQFTKIARFRWDWCGSDSSCAPGFSPTTLGYRGAIRDDSAARKVWIRLPGYSDDSLLFDFSLSLGDTMRCYITNNHKYVVTSVSTYPVSGFNLRYLALYHFSDPFFPMIHIVEGVGNLGSGLEPVQRETIQSFSLYCFESTELSEYACEFCCSSLMLPFQCTIQHVADDEPSSMGGIQLVPSIGNGHFQIDWKDVSTSKVTASIITPSGCEVHNSELDRNQKELDLSMLPSGMYWVQFVGTYDSDQYQKIIVFH